MAPLVGRLANGKKFNLPPLRDALNLGITSPFDCMKYALLLTLGVLWTNVPGWAYIAWFAVWRLAYNVGIGYVLHTQSKSHAFTKLYTSLRKSNGTAFRVIKHLLVQDLNGDAAQFNALPAEACAWLMFRRLVDVVLNCDLAAYFLLCLKFTAVPDAPLDSLAYAQYGVGFFLALFALWGKYDAYTVIGTFAWYWGDFFFLCDQDLNFSRGVYAIFPHPMYTVGYFFMYGFALLSSSYTVLVVSLVAHAMQLVFLKYVEDPHIEKTYDVANAKKVAAKERLETNGAAWNTVRRRLRHTEVQVKQRANALLQRLKNSD